MESKQSIKKKDRDLPQKGAGVAGDGGEKKSSPH